MEQLQVLVGFVFVCGCQLREQNITIENGEVAKQSLVKKIFATSLRSDLCHDFNMFFSGFFFYNEKQHENICEQFMVKFMKKIWFSVFCRKNENFHRFFIFSMNSHSGFHKTRQKN